jgi:4-diphosphocytidyl-2C-methyl-D-erythritol kinase
LCGKSSKQFFTFDFKIPSASPPHNDFEDGESAGTEDQNHQLTKKTNRNDPDSIARPVLVNVLKFRMDEDRNVEAFVQMSGSGKKWMKEDELESYDRYWEKKRVWNYFVQMAAPFRVFLPMAKNFGICSK